MLNELLDQLVNDVRATCQKGYITRCSGVGDGGDATKSAILAEVQRLVEAEREACASLCLETGIKTAAQTGQAACAAAIRMRSNK